MRDLTVIGGGAAGFFTALSFAERTDSKPASVLILEKAPEVLQKVKISGGGRCNVTHDCHDPREFVTYYPRGEKSLPGPIHRWNASDMLDWLEARDVEVKAEADGRMFPVTNDSQTIIDCFLNEAERQGIDIRCRQPVASVTRMDSGDFSIELKSGEVIDSKQVMIATGGIRNSSGQEIAETFGHKVFPAAPSLFTFCIGDKRIEELSGISVNQGTVSLDSGSKLSQSGPILITHWGLSGPAVLKLSARAARELQEENYRFPVTVNWTNESTLNAVFDKLTEFRAETGRQSVRANAKFGIPTRLWRSLCEAAGLANDLKWGNSSKLEMTRLTEQLFSCQFKVTGKSMNKDEFVTCGGIDLNEINLQTMESKLVAGLFFAGEVLNIDGVTGGFNFQSAWTTARIAGEAMANAD